MKVSLIILIIGLITIAPSIYVGIKFFDGKVVEQPYESGLTYDADKKFISDNGLKLTILTNEKTDKDVKLAFSFDKNDNINIEETSFFITRPATNQGNIKLDAKIDKDGVYASAFKLENYGHYILKAITTINGKKIAIQKGFYIN